MVVCLITIKYFEYLPYILLPITVLLKIPTVYRYYHYLVDVVFGVLCGLFFYHLSENVYKMLKVVDKKTDSLFNSLIISK